MILFGALILAHLLYDFHWQGSFISKMKGKSWYLLGVHALTWALLLCAVLRGFGELTWWHLPFLAITHFLIDAWKARYTDLEPLGTALWIDQGLHYLTMIIVAL